MSTKQFTYGKQPSQFAELRLPSTTGPHPVIITIHGGFWKDKFDLNILNPLAEDLTSRGFATWNIEYRRVGEEGGGYPGTMLDVGQAIDYLENISTEYNLDLERVSTVGHSAGGHLAIWSAARYKLPTTSELYLAEPLTIHHAVSLAGVLDFQAMEETHRTRLSETGATGDNPVLELMGGTIDEVPERYRCTNPLQLLPETPKQTLIHGSLDINVPIGISENYKQLADKQGLEDIVKLIKIPTAEHFKITNPTSNEWAIVVKEIETNC